MAQSTSDISTVLSTLFRPDIVKAFNRSALTASLFNAKMATGLVHNWTVQVAGATAAWVAEGADVSSYTNDTYKKMYLEMAIVEQNFSVTDLAASSAALAQGSASAVMRLIGEGLLNGANSLASAINSQVFTGTGTSGGQRSLYGFDSVIKTSGSYGGQDYGTVTGLQSSVVNAAGALTVAHLETLDSYNYSKTSQPFSHLIVSPTTFRLAKGLFSRSLSASQPGLVSLITDMEFNGAKVVRDKDAPDGYVYGIHAEDWEFVVIPKLESDRVSMGSEGFAPSIPVDVSKLDRTGSTSKFMLQSQLQLVCKAPHRQGKIYGITG